MAFNEVPVVGRHHAYSRDRSFCGGTALCRHIECIRSCTRLNTWKPTSVGAHNLIVEIYINIAYGQLLVGNYCGLCVQRLPLPQAFHHCK